MKKIYLYIAFAMTTIGSFAQVNVQASPSVAINNENPFLDLSGYKNAANNIGKGIYFPRTDLTTWEFKTTSINPGKFSSYFDGMIVYNTATGSTLADVTKGGKQVSVSPGFYYFYNPNKNAPSGNINEGEWKRLDATANADNGLTIETEKVQLGGSLNKATTITTTAANTLSLKGLGAGINNPEVNYSGNTTKPADQLLAIDKDGVIKQVKAAIPKFFYAPAIYVPTHEIDPIAGTSIPYSNGAPAIDLYNEYYKQFVGYSGSYAASDYSSKLPVLGKSNLDYFITYYDNTVFEDVTISTTGILNYRVKANPIITGRTFINVVFKVKD